MRSTWAGTSPVSVKVLPSPKLLTCRFGCKSSRSVHVSLRLLLHTSRVHCQTARCRLTSSHTFALTTSLAVAWISLTVQSICQAYPDWVLALIWMLLSGIRSVKQLSRIGRFPTSPFLRRTYATRNNALRIWASTPQNCATTNRTAFEKHTFFQRYACLRKSYYV